MKKSNPVRKVGLALATAVSAALISVPSAKAISGGTREPIGSDIQRRTVLISFLDRYDPSGTKNDKCSGTLVGDRVVLTAAHCISTQMWIIFTSFQNFELTQDIRRVELVATHDSEDLALLMFEGQRPKSTAVAKLWVDRPGRYRSSVLAAPFQDELAEGTMIIAAGYGKTALKGGETSGTLRSAEMPFHRHNRNIDKALTHQPDGRGVCPGDSGGPGFIRLHGELYVWGVASDIGFGITKGYPCAEMGIYTDLTVPKNYLWVQDTLRKLNRFSRQWE